MSSTFAASYTHKYTQVELNFSKYHGAGNDFIILDNRSAAYALSAKEIELLCHRRFGIGADGLMLIEQSETVDFKMVYYNADGYESTMCGNGGRCIVQYAADIGIIGNDTVFIAIDGLHHAQVIAPSRIALGMIDVQEVMHDEGAVILNTGSPHVVKQVADLYGMDVDAEGRYIRNLPRYGAKGINVNFIQQINKEWHIRTYERGVEAETLACGTGVTAAALSLSTQPGKYNIDIQAQGGQLSVAYEKIDDHTFRNIVLTGPAVKVFDGVVDTDFLMNASKNI